MASEAVLKFLEEHNRPFSISEVERGVTGDFGKTAIQKALDSLVQKENVKEKVYCIMQKDDGSSSELRESLLEIDRKINERALQLKEVTDKLKSYSADVAQLKGKITLADAMNQKLQLEKELEDVKTQLEKYSETKIICPKRKLLSEKEYEKYLSDYKKRKRICMDVVNSILENYSKSKKHLFEDIGIETDEDVGFSLNKL
ncbi:hypothetical protein NQ314_018493 [Rhamnusium bicolor]|uniref:Homologous-pairing protein 2 homolog n=1 Tax=Rhamnusium bicolor TaxID=1586634 RepID=A0AAV8WRQ0_9CUCU|nr:hypothetical protein NQ314_018493 [Rhamnusium bicolor]